MSIEIYYNMYGWFGPLKMNGYVKTLAHLTTWTPEPYFSNNLKSYRKIYEGSEAGSVWDIF